MDVWPLVHRERHALAADLTALDASQWDLPSLCPGWSVHDVAAHLVHNARTTPLRLLAAMARARFDFDRQNQQGVERERGATPSVTLERLREVADRTSGPPAPLVSRLVEEILHGEDVRRPLGLEHAYDPQAISASLAYVARTSVALGGGKQRVAGLRLVPTDHGEPLGDGPEARGPALSLLLAASGRTVAVSDLDGPGAERLT